MPGILMSHHQQMWWSKGEQIMDILGFEERENDIMIKDQDKGVLSFIQEAEKAADIVSKSVENDELSEVGRKLQKFTMFEKEKEHFVFERPALTRWVISVVISMGIIVLFVYYLMISVGTFVYSSTYRMYGICGILFAMIVVIINLLVIRKSIQEIRFCKRYDHYSNVLKYHSTEIVDDLVNMLDVDKKVVENDLSKAIGDKLIPQGHLVRGNTIFMVSDAIFREYSSRRAVYDRYYRKLIEERNRLKKRTPETEKLLEQGQEYIDKIRDCNDIIKDKEVSLKLSQMEKVVAAIFHEVDINPNQASKLGLFISYYLPTTEKLLEKYMDIDEKQVKGKSLKKAQKDITDALDSINNAFESLLERFYQEQEIDVAGDISAMEIIMQQEGLQNNE